MTQHAQSGGLGTRKLASWIAGFLEYTEGIWSDELFRLWTAISTVAGALEKKVWIRSQGSSIYPNLYVFLVGPPGAGKTRPIDICAELWSALPEHHVAPVSLTKAALMDRVASASRAIPHHAGDLTFNALLIASKELGALIPNYDSDFLNALTYLYDNMKYDEERRGAKEPLVIESPIVNIIAATTPSYLLDTMPIGAWDQGFLARVIMVYADVAQNRKLDLMSDEISDNEPLRASLIHDLRAIGNQVGRMRFTHEAAELVEKWHGSKEDAPAHPRLINYNTRRTIHLLKLCMVAAVDRGAMVEIELEDAITAIDWLTRAETFMPDIFIAMNSGGDAAVITEAIHYLTIACVRTNGPVPAHMLYHFLQGKVPAHSVSKIITLMLQSHLIKAETKEGGTFFWPGANRAILK